MKRLKKTKQEEVAVLFPHPQVGMKVAQLTFTRSGSRYGLATIAEVHPKKS